MAKKFLLVDDDIDDAYIFREAVGRIQSVECFTAESGLDLFDLLGNYGIRSSDVIFLDINMPSKDGWECLKELKGSFDHSSIPTIMYSTSSAKNDIDKAYRLGAQLFMTKPDDIGELCEILAIVATSPQESFADRLKKFRNVTVRG